MWIYICGLVLLIMLSVVDIKYKSIPVYAIFIVVVTMFLMGLTGNREIDIWGVIGFIILAAFMALFKVGAADIYISVGIYFIWGFYKAVMIIWVGFILCGCVGIILVILKQLKVKNGIPFIPFMTIGYVVVMLLEAL